MVSVLSESDPIDAVVSWVDGNDPQFLEKKERAARLEGSYVRSKNADTAARYQQSDEIFFTLHLIRKNAPWVRKIFLITDAQRPDWLTDNLAKQLGVQVIDHSELFSGYSNVLPTFNSKTIETMLARVPGIARRFIYLNDDMFIVGKVEPSDFFLADESLIARGRLGFKRYALDKKLRRATFWHRRGYICRRPGTSLLPGWLFYLDMAHAPHGVFKEDFESVFHESRLRENIKYRFRGEDQLCPVGFVINNSSRYRRVKRQDNDWLCVYPNDLLREPLSDTLEIRPGLKFLCIQEMSDLPEDHLRMTKDTLQRCVGV